LGLLRPVSLGIGKNKTDGSPEQMNRALLFTQLCWNLALLPEDMRENSIANMQPILKMGDANFDDFRHSIVNPMLKRHQDMFPRMHGSNIYSISAPATQPRPTAPIRIKKYPGTGRNEPCPYNSGRKYKLCCVE
jgi:hypothetical protein